MIRKILIALCAVAVILAASIAAQAEDTSSPSRQDVEKLLSILYPDVKVIAIAPAMVGGLKEVIIEVKGEKGIVYLDYARQKAIFGSLVDIRTRTNLTKRTLDSLATVDFASIPLADAIVLGNPTARNRAIVFDDPD